MKHIDALMSALSAQRLPDGRTWLDVVRAEAARCGVKPISVMSPGRTRSVAMARHRSWWALKTDPTTDYSYPEIANVWGVDHTVIMWGVAKIARIEAAKSPERPGLATCPTTGEL